jgi:ferredoxin
MRFPLNFERSSVRKFGLSIDFPGCGWSCYIGSMADVSFRLKDGSERKVGFCEPNLNLLAHAQSIELDIGSECGGHGICGKDRIRLDPAGPTSRAVSPVSQEERRHLSPAELAQGWRLGCQCFPDSADQEVVAEVP